MSRNRTAWIFRLVVVVVAYLVVVDHPRLIAADAPAAAPVSTTVLTNAALKKVEIPKSVFSTEPTFGFDPFYPASSRRIEPEPVTTEPAPKAEPEPQKPEMVNVRTPDTTTIVAPEEDDFSFLAIKGITATARRRTLTLHTTVRSYTFRDGDEYLVRVPDGSAPGGKMRVRCLEIRGRSAVFKLQGRAEPVELFMGRD